MAPACHDHAWAFIRAGQHGTNHHCLRAGGDRFRNISWLTNPTICNNGNSILTSGFRAFDDGCQLWNTRAGHNPRDANGSRSYANFYGIDTCLNKPLRTLRAGNISADDLSFRKMVPNIPDHLKFEM